MTKIGNEISFNTTAGSNADSARPGDQLRFARTLESRGAASPTSPETGGRSSAAGASTGTKAPVAPPTYDLTQTVSFETVHGLVEALGGNDASTLAALSHGVGSEALPGVAVIGAQQVNQQGAPKIVALGNTIFMPASTFAAWTSAGKADAEGAAAFTRAFSDIVARSAHRNG